MPELYRALIVVLVIGLAGQWLAKQALVPHYASAKKQKSGIDPDFWRVWAIVTLFGFLAHDTWVFLGATSLYLISIRRKQSSAIGLFLAVILIMPPVRRDLPTFGLVQHLLPLDLAAVAGLLLLGPGLFRKDETSSKVGRNWVLIYVLWLIVLAFFAANFTSFLRDTSEILLAIALPFEGARRSVRSPGDLKRICELFLTMCLTLAVLAIFEHMRAWLLFHEIPLALGSPNAFGNYLARGSDLRAEVTTGQPIVLGYVIAMGLIFALSTEIYRGSLASRKFVIPILIGGLYSSLSRGPWIGAAVGVFVFFLLGKNGVRRGFQLGCAAVGVLTAAPFLPGGQKILNLLPFIGTSEADTVSYRQDLFHAVTPLLIDSPVFGIPDYNHQPELQFLRQGEGIIDLVNTYIQVGVSSGLVGLSFFLMAHLSVVLGLLRMVRRKTDGQNDLLRAFFAAYVTAMVIIATTSSISYIAVIYWAFLGIGSALIGLDQVVRKKALFDQRRANAVRSPAQKLLQAQES